MKDLSNEIGARETAAAPGREQDQERRRFLKLTALGVGSGIALSQLGCKPAVESKPEPPSPPPATPPEDVINTGVLVTRGVGGTVTSKIDRSIYQFELSATYNLTGEEISIESLSLSGKPVYGRGAGELAISKVTDLRAKLDASQCFRITGAVGITDDISAKVLLDGCVISNAVPSLRGVLYASGERSIKITFS